VLIQLFILQSVHSLVPVSYLSAPSAVHSYRVPGKFNRRLKSLFVGWKVYSSSTNKAKIYTYRASKARQRLAILPVSKARNNKFYIYRQCTYIVYILIVYMGSICMYIDCVYGCNIHVYWLYILVLYTCILMMYMGAIYMYISHIHSQYTCILHPKTQSIYK
jgi:hypothetical protein